MSVDTSELEAYARRLEVAAVGIRARASLAVRKVAYDVEAAAKVAAPVDTGNLRSSISTTITGAGSNVITAEVGPTADYGVFVEEGTSVQAPQPYLGPAADRHLPQLETALLAALTEGL